MLRFSFRDGTQVYLKNKAFSRTRNTARTGTYFIKFGNLNTEAGKGRILFFERELLSKGIPRGVLGCPWPPPFASLFNLTTYNRWRKFHDNILAIVTKPFFLNFFLNQKHGLEIDMTIWWVPPLWHSVTTPPPFEKSWLRLMGVSERYGWEKEVEICGKEGKDSSAKVLKSLKVQKHPSFLSRTWRDILNQGETSTGAMVLSS